MKVEGVAALRRKLTRTIPEAVVKATEAAMEKGAEEIVRRMRRRVPKDTGRLRDSIGWTWGEAPEGAVVVAQSAVSSDTGLKITIYAGIAGNNNYDQGFYVRFIEFGTQKMAAQPFFFPSHRELKRRVSNRIRREMRKAIRTSSRS